MTSKRPERETWAGVLLIAALLLLAIPAATWQRRAWIWWLGIEPCRCGAKAGR